MNNIDKLFLSINKIIKLLLRNVSKNKPFYN